MGEVAVGEGRTESFNSTNQDHKTRCGPALIGHEGTCIPINLSQRSCDDDALNHENISLLQRIDRLDNILTTMEEKVPTEENNSSVTSPRARRRPSSLDNRYRCKSTESVLEEVEEKGTLVERVTKLEKRINKLQRRMCAHSTENAAVLPSTHWMTPHDQAIPHYDDDQQSLQHLADVEKHEVTSALTTSVAIEPGQRREAFTSSEKNDISSRKGETSHMDQGHEGKVSASESTSVDEGDPRVNYQKQKQSKKKSIRIKKWLSKRLHISFPGMKQDKRTHFTRCWSSNANPKNCWNVNRGMTHARPTYAQYSHHLIDEDSS